MRNKEMTIGTNVNNNFPDEEEDYTRTIQDKLESNEDFIKYQGTVPIP